MKATAIDKGSFEIIHAYQAEYFKDLRKKQRQIKTLQEIDSKYTARVIDDIERQFDERWMEKRKHVRTRDIARKIKDQDKRKKVQYKVNLCIRCPEKAPEFKTAQEFFEWCGVDVSEPP